MPAIALLPAIIGAGGAIGGALLSRPSGAQNRAMNAQSALDAQMAQNAQQEAQLGGQWAGMATPALQNSLNYWQTLLSGDRTAMSQALGPEIQQYSQGQQNALTNMSQFAPRSGARATMIGEMPFQSAQTIGNMFASLRPQAAQQVGALGSTLGSMATSAYGGSNAGAQGAANNYMSLVAMQEALRQNQMNNAAGIGRNLYSWAKGVDWSKVFGGGGSNTGGWDPTQDPSICWIAAELWGWHDLRTHILRTYIIATGGLRLRLYKRFGQRIAIHIRNHPVSHRVASLVFEIWLEEAILWAR